MSKEVEAHARIHKSKLPPLEIPGRVLHQLSDIILGFASIPSIPLSVEK